jgi:tyrosinase
MTHLRKNVWWLAETDPIVVAYGDAVTAMQHKPASDPTSWAYQAAIHGTLASSPPPLGHECRHQTWFFLPWHRMYLYWFERIVRAQVVALGGPADWALPYWDYDTTTTNTLPLAFRHPTRADGGTNPLYVAERDPLVNAGGSFDPSVTSASFALSRTTYTGDAEFGGGITPPGTTFWHHTGRLEQTPHNDMHGQIGGSSGWMSFPSTAAQDPIFWLHHSNIDRLWWTWQKTYDEPTDTAWTGQSFDFFDEHGHRVSMTCADVLDTVTQLDYTYPGKLSMIPFPHLPPLRPIRPIWPRWIPKVRLPVPVEPDHPRIPPGPGPDPGPEFVGASEQAVRLVGRPEQVRVVVDRRARTEALRGRAQPRRVVLAVEDIEAEANPGTTYGVYVNLPEQPTEEDLATHHAGNVSFFGIERARNPRGDEPPHGMRVAMDITELTAALAERGEWDDEAEPHVTFRPIGVRPPAGARDLVREGGVEHENLPVTIGRVSLHVD